VAPRVFRFVVKHGQQLGVGQACNCPFTYEHGGPNDACAESYGRCASDTFNAVEADSFSRAN